MELKDVLYEKRERIAWVTLNRPHALNALTAEMMRSLGLAAEDARDDDTVRALVITGAGRAFCWRIFAISLPCSPTSGLLSGPFRSRPLPPLTAWSSAQGLN